MRLILFILQILLILSTALVGEKSYSYSDIVDDLFAKDLCNKSLQNRCSENEKKFLNQILETCQLNYKSAQCEQFKKDNPKEAWKVFSCDVAEFCEERTENTWLKVGACVKGIVQNAEDLLKMADDVFIFFKNNVETKNKFMQQCNQSMNCKKSLLVGTPLAKTISNADLEKMSAAQLYVQAENQRNIIRQLQRSQTQSPSTMTPNKGSSGDLAASTPIDITPLWTSLWDMAEQEAVNTYRGFQCYRQIEKDRVKCKIYSTLGIFTKAGKTSEVFKPFKALSSTERAAKEKALREEVRSGGSEYNKASRSSYEKRMESPGDFINKYKSYEPTTTEQNRQWIQLARSNDKDSKFFEAENSVMKNLNDIFSKDKVTALTNKHKEILHQRMSDFEMALKKHFPDCQLFGYSDFKAHRFAFRGACPSEASLFPELRKVFKDTNDEFLEYSKAQKLITGSDLKAVENNPDKWFKAGFGETADQASFASRSARRSSDSFLSYSDSDVQSRGETLLREVEAQRVQIRSQLRNTDLLDSKASSATLRPEVFDIVKKNASNEAAEEALKNRYGLRSIPAGLVDQIRNYQGLVDNFSPAIHIEKREFASLTDATHGGLSADMVGMGSKNIYSTAKALAKTENLSESLDIARYAEQQITIQFKDTKDLFKTIVNDTLGANTVKTVCSGDDCVSAFTRKVSDQEKAIIMHNMAQQGQASQFRFSFISDQVTNEKHRGELATHGEQIEKILRKSLSAQMDPKKLDGIAFGIDMIGTAVGQGPVGLRMGVNTNVQLSSSEIELIKKKFKEAIEKENISLNSMGNTHANYQIQSLMLNR